jgi:hypothetical protein
MCSGVRQVARVFVPLVVAPIPPPSRTVHPRAALARIRLSDAKTSKQTLLMSDQEEARRLGTLQQRLQVRCAPGGSTLPLPHCARNAAS